MLLRNGSRIIYLCIMPDLQTIVSPFRIDLFTRYGLVDFAVLIVC